VPAGWVGKVWALERGLHEARTPWVLGIDADTTPQPGMVGGALAAAESLEADVVSFGPRFAAQGAGERWLQPALLTTLVYRFGPAGEAAPDPDRVMANGQCFLARREVLLRHGGYAPARASFCDDVTLARHLARTGARVRFLDGSRLLDVRAYTGALETWREWGRSLDLKDASTPARQALDVAFLLLVQGLPIPLLLWLLLASPAIPGWLRGALLGVNGALLAVRLLITLALRGSYERTGLPFWLSPLADPLAAFRILLSSLRRPASWRGRRY
jgi:dolichol-phosphate mannosyltransferase